MANLIWSPSAKDTYANILEELDLDTALKLDDQVEALIDNLQKFTNLCPPSKKFPSFRKCVVNKHVSVIYSTDNKTVHLIAFYYNKAGSNF